MPTSVVTDSVASIPAKQAEAASIDVVSLYVNDGERHEADLDIELESFYRRLADMKDLPTSSQPSVEALASAFRRGLERGTDVLGVFISSKMSGTVETAMIAADLVRDQTPGARIEILDSGSNSLEEGFIALAAAAAARGGAAIEGCIDAALDTARRTRYLFSPASLEYLRRGGRIGSASALLGQLLQIRPILTVSGGETDTLAKVRTASRALAEMARVFSDDVEKRGLVRAAVHYIGDIEPAQHFAEKAIAPVAGFEVEVVPVSAVIGLHVGPAVGLVYETETEPASPVTSAQHLLEARS